ncbi:Putative acetyltransferase YafP [Erwinia sp. Ejp617]|nr:GNAT family N-acetyltransferase [Erwinia sp. Ejp617]ADP12583.1 Putative acetyltransferase YafP [Erwinia sp. Ejp617]
MEITIRRYQPADLTTVIAVFQRAVRLIAARDYSQQQTEAWSHADRTDWKRRLDNGDVWVACHNNKVIGFTLLEAHGHLDLLFTDAGYQRCGVATLLMNTLEQAATEKGLKQVDTEASITAKSFFMQRGYQLVAQQSVAVRGQYFINFRMRKGLIGKGT